MLPLIFLMLFSSLAFAFCVFFLFLVLDEHCDYPVLLVFVFLLL